MAFRAVYILNYKEVGDRSKTVLFKRTFPVMEKKCEKILGKEKYIKIPPNFPSLIIEELELNRSPHDEFNERFDSCSRIRTPPIYRLCNGSPISISPIVAFEKFGLLYCCVVFEEHEQSHDEARRLSTGTVFALTMLENMASYISTGNTKESLEDKLQFLHRYVSIGFPFGIPSELDISTVKAMLSAAEGASLPKIKGPAWRPIAYKGKQTLHLSVREKVRALQFDHKDIPDRCEVFGTISCKAEVEESPEVSISLIAPLESNVLTQMMYHPSVQLIDDLRLIITSDDRKNDGEIQYGARKLRFCPPHDEFSLCHYKAQLTDGELPVQTFYQMKGDSRNVNILIQLKLNSKMKNNFETFDVTIPFFNRGPIVNINCLTSSANVSVTQDKSKLIWIVGSKFPGKTNDFSLEATITFDDSLGYSCIPNDVLNGVNSYIQISFKVNDFTYSGIKFDSKSVELSPSSKIKVISASEFRTVEYKVWNSHGDVTDSTFKN